MVDDTGNQVPQFSLFGAARDPGNGLMIRLPQVKTAAAAIKTAGLDWQVVKKPISVVDEGRAIGLRANMALSGKTCGPNLIVPSSG